LELGIHGDVQELKLGRRGSSPRGAASADVVEVRGKAEFKEFRANCFQ